MMWLVREREVEMAKQFRIWALLVYALVSTAILIGPAVAQVSKADGKEWGDECIRTSGGPSRSLSENQRCCQEQAEKKNKACKDDPSNVVCVNTVKICKEMVKCDDTLNKCKIKAMETDKDCSKDTCKQCTADYKSCHDSALN
jgi:hypothetical protein